jgi:hypothetical protein
VLCTLEQWGGLDEHEDGKDDKVRARQGFGQSFIIASQAPKPGDPAETALHHPPPGQQHKASFGLRQLDHVQPNTLPASGLGRVVAGVALIDKGHFDLLAGNLLNRSRQFRHLGTLLLVG